jgi:hypothetical protein
MRAPVFTRIVPDTQTRQQQAFSFPFPEDWLFLSMTGGERISLADSLVYDHVSLAM